MDLSPSPGRTTPQEWLAAAREGRVRCLPGRGAGDLRLAYLELLKLCLCDLAGTSTTSVGAMGDGSVLARELRGEARRLRAAGMDWPLHGLTMVGLRRLDDLQACVEAIVADGVEGDVIEAGSWRGGASMLMRATLDTLGDPRTVVVADSFQGFPADPDPDPQSARLSSFDFLAVPVEEVAESFARLGLDRGVELVPGFLETTLPPLAGRQWSLIRLDADAYQPTRLAIRTLYPGLRAGGYLVIDDYGSFDGCRKAIDEFRDEFGITDEIEPVDHTGARWRRTDDAPIEVPPEASTEPPSAIVRPSGPRDVPTVREAELEQRLANVTAELEAARAELAHARRGRLRRALRRRPPIV